MTGRPTIAEAAKLEERLSKAAVELFLEQGFDGTTMEGVAQAAGISKRTLYARYADKHELFAAVVASALIRQRGDDASLEVPPDDLEAGLTAIARSSLARALDPEIVRLSRIAMNEATRFPKFARTAQSMSWSPRIQAVQKLLTHHIELGTVEVDDVEIASEQFLALVAAMPARLAAFGVRRPRAVEERHLRHAVGLFLRGVLARG
jgi:AcrR family transcriptional regulator